MANTIDCKSCGSAAVVLVWSDEETGEETVGLWCEFCGADVQTPAWLELHLKEAAEIKEGG